MLALSTHTLAETYKVLTAHPKIALPPVAAHTTPTALSLKTRIVSLDLDDYLLATARCARLRLPGGAIYDTLIAQAAVKGGAQQLVTLNAKHFRRLGEDVASLVIAPDWDEKGQAPL